MKKPLNKIALALWILAALFVMEETWTLAEMFRIPTGLRGDMTYVVGGSISRFIQSVVATAGLLTGIGVLIELVDQIRWTVVRASEKS